MIAAKLIFLTLSLIFQTKVFPENPPPHVEYLDTLAMPMENPELAMAERALKAHGLTGVAHDGGKGPAFAASIADSDLSVGESETSSICANPASGARANIPVPAKISARSD